MKMQKIFYNTENQALTNKFGNVHNLLYLCV